MGVRVIPGRAGRGRPGRFGTSRSHPAIGTVGATVTRTALGTDDFNDDDPVDAVLEYGRRKYEEAQEVRAVLHEARQIARDAEAERHPRPDPRLLPEPERRRADRDRR